MKAHELARILLEGPDLEVELSTPHYLLGTVAEVNRVELEGVRVGEIEILSVGDP